MPEAQVPQVERAVAVYVEFPQTDHGFDIILPRLNPATQN